MADLKSWCDAGALAPIGKHQAGVLESNDDAAGVAALASALPVIYAQSEALAQIAQRHGKEGVAKFLRNKLPTEAKARSGDMGEILATAYLREACGYVVGPSLPLSLGSGLV